MNSDSSSPRQSDTNYQTTPKAVLSLLPGGKYDSLQVLAKILDSLAAGETGYVKFQGSLWKAANNTSFTLDAGTLVRVVDRQNLTLVIEPLTQDELYRISLQEVAIAAKSQSAFKRLNQVDAELGQLKEKIRVLEEISHGSKARSPSIHPSKMNNLGMRGDRMIAMTAGGAFLGGTIGLAPGAVIGATAGAIFALLAKVD